ncbi:MAG: hypothetical protein N3E47_03990 [Candidatus Bathyarchaeota archaeon]|nr:hypothetical protein [Candidatus Bathyarchaeota archaeon]
MEEPLPRYKSSRWIDSSGEPVSRCLVYDKVFGEVVVENPLRMRSAIGLIKVAIFKSSRFLPDISVKQSKHIVTLPPLSDEKILIPFKPPYESEYYYKVYIEDREVYAQPKDSPPRLYVSRRESKLIVDKITEISRNPGFTVTGKLIDAATNEGIGKAQIKIYDARTLRNDEIIACCVTKEDGSFVANGLKPFKIGRQIRFYVKFEGDDIYKPVISSHFTVDLT